MQPHLTLCRFLAGLLAVPALAATGSINLTLNGSAQLVTAPKGNTIIALTPLRQNQAGSAFTSEIVPFGPKFAFATFFQFRMSTNDGFYPAADGFAFVLQTAGPTALGGDGAGLGYLNITPSIAVEFDTYMNAPFDPNSNHVAILTQGQLNDMDPQSPYGVADCTYYYTFGCMGNGDVWSVWIGYDGTNLSVALADNSTVRPANLIEFPIDIASQLGQTSAYVGFTGATGSMFATHEIASWEFPDTQQPVQ